MPALLRQAPPSRRLALAAAVLLVGVGGVLLFILRDGGRSPGPVVVDEANRLSGSVPTGREFMYGIPVIYNDGDEPAVLERARFYRATPGLEIVKTLVAGPKRELNLVSSSRRWPAPKDFRPTDLRPLRGYRLAPRSEPTGEFGVELVLVMRVRRPGRYITRGVQLDYRVGGDRHRRILPNGYAACAKPRGTDLLKGPFCRSPPPALGEL